MTCHLHSGVDAQWNVNTSETTFLCVIDPITACEQCDVFWGAALSWRQNISNVLVCKLTVLARIDKENTYFEYVHSLSETVSNIIKSWLQTVISRKFSNASRVSNRHQAYFYQTSESMIIIWSVSKLLQSCCSSQIPNLARPTGAETWTWWWSDSSIYSQPDCCKLLNVLNLRTQTGLRKETELLEQHIYLLIKLVNGHSSGSDSFLLFLLF